MNNSESLSSTSRSKPQQLPLKGFKTPVEKFAGKREAYIEGMGDGRYRIHVTAKTR